jgi:hypothetical protein
VWCPVNNFTEALDFSEDGIGGSDPDEGPSMSVIESDVAIDFTDELADAAERAAPNGLLRNQRKVVSVNW